MFARVFQPLTFSTVAVVLLHLINNCASTNPSTFSDAVATWYGSPMGFGSGSSIIITITDECPGACNNEAFHFDLSGKAFGSLAKPGHADALRKAGKIDIKYKRVQCNYNAGMTFKIDSGSNPNYLAFAIEHVHGDGDVASVEISASNSKGWMAMQPSWGATWKVGLPVGLKGPYSVRVTTIQSGRKVVAHQAIPANWAPGQHYLSNTK
ncbi:Expansin-B12 [Sesamum angolense]|uniref:Expansin-B12 n=1 Tax=Sesamum angolense TaxID=2727404 RepID=A0AAE1X361_9LAMI|nr:Expansin-B12 [Sesamum angolense]